MSTDPIIFSIQDKASLLRGVADELDEAAERLRDTGDLSIPCDVVGRLTSLSAELDLGKLTASTMLHLRGMNFQLNEQNKQLKETVKETRELSVPTAAPYVGSPLTATSAEDISKLSPEMWQTLSSLYLRLVERETKRRDNASRPPADAPHEWPHQSTLEKVAARSAESKRCTLTPDEAEAKVEADAKADWLAHDHDLERDRQLERKLDAIADAEQRAIEDGSHKAPTVAPSETSGASGDASKPWDFLKEVAKSGAPSEAAYTPNGPWDSFNDAMLAEDALEARLEAAHEEAEQEHRRSLEIEAAVEDAADAEYDDRDGGYAKDAEALMDDVDEDFTDERPLGYDHRFGDNRDCECGHHYERHFDLTAPYPEAQEASCKRCGCTKFVEAGGPPSEEGAA